MRNIKNAVRKIATKLHDEAGYFKRAIQIKRLAKYTNEIDMVLTKYNKKSCDETMMVKGLRKSNAETTNRKIHQEDLEKIVVQLAKEIGLNKEIVAIMGKHHDIGHTFLGHSGEWWISNILEDYGLEYFCHNTLGARELIYTDNVYKEIIEKIKEHNPHVSERTIRKIQDSLWIIMDGINAHNGEKPEKEYIPQINKTESEFIKELINCYVKKGYDRKITPGSSEACLMRLADQISYIPLDMVDGLREKMIRDYQGNIVTVLDDDYREILTSLGITNEEIDIANKKGEFTKIAERLKEIFIQDVIKNSTKHKITMSKEVMTNMNKLRDLNNAKIVDNVVLIEDQETYPPAIRTLINRYKDIILENKLLDKLNPAKSSDEIDEDLAQYEGTPDEGFIKYISNMNTVDFYLTEKITRLSSIESISQELDIARECVQKGRNYLPEQECGLSYDMKNSRIASYIKYYQERLAEGSLIGYTDEHKKGEINRIYNNIEYGKKSKDMLNKKERMAISIAAKYISTLSDREFLQLLKST